MIFFQLEKAVSFLEESDAFQIYLNHPDVCESVDYIIGWHELEMDDPSLPEPGFLKIRVFISDTFTCGARSDLNQFCIGYVDTFTFTLVIIFLCFKTKLKLLFIIHFTL